MIPVVAGVREQMAVQGGYVDVGDDHPLPGVEWRLEVNRELMYHACYVSIIYLYNTLHL